MSRDSRDQPLLPNSETLNLSRRELFQYAGIALTASALPAEAGAGPQPARAEEDSNQAVSPLMTKLSTYMAAARDRELPHEVSEKLKLHVLDTFAAIISGTQLAAGPATMNFARSYGGKEVSTVICSKVVCGPLEAALINGTLAHADETDDVHPLGPHPGCAVIPATFAVGEQFGIGGTHFLRAVSLGYDIIPRLALAFGGLSGMRSPAFVTVFGAAAGAASAASLNEEQMRWAIDYTTQQTSGIRAWERDVDHIEKGFAIAGMTARSGATSALLVHSGWTGVNDALSGEDNLFVAYGPAKPEELIKNLGEDYGVMGTSIKKWSVGQPMQTPMDAMYYLLQKHKFELDQITQVVARMPSTELVSNRDMPDICLQHMLAVMMIDKTATFQSAHDKARMQDPAVLRQRAKIKLVDDDQFQKRGLKQGAVVEVTLADGTVLSERAEAVRGTPQNPMTSEEILAKSRELISPVLGAPTAAKLIEKTLKLEAVKDVREFRPLLQKA